MTQQMSSSELPKTYAPSVTEEKIYQSWIEGNYFVAKVDPSKKPFTVIMPPPNVTGELHYGHALTIALEDLMVRWHRMRGFSALYLPGTDHAGIATQVVVERMLAREKITRFDLGREGFVKKVWEWVDQYGDRIYEQIKRLGASCDWSRKAFTLDPGPSKAVRSTFVNLYQKDLIYRGERIVNWCTRCSTALSDLEVKYEEEKGYLYLIKYYVDSENDYLTIATTRPETLVGDTAVAVNPNDERYRKYIGRFVLLPILGRKIPVIADEAVDMQFGTGALKVTPGHDANDFDMKNRHDLEMIYVMNRDGSMNENAGKYDGLDRFAARDRIVEDLEKAGLLEAMNEHQHSVGHCDRCTDVIEPLVSKQWYVKMEPLAKPAIEAVENGSIQLVPERFSKVYFNWMYNIRDWCISRQLWWGHRIPAWYCNPCGKINVSLEDPTECTNCSSTNIEQDPDMLDTWFSSGLWTHSTLGWPELTDDLEYFYPSTVMETGHDILFFWVARMIISGIENIGDIPFKTVYLHGLVRDPEGAKMSKSKGNVRDPLELIDNYGADALRFALTTGNSPGNDMRLTDEKMQSSRNFTNKLWNAARFVISNISNDETKFPLTCSSVDHVEDRWIISRLNQTIGQVNRHMEEFQFGEAQRNIHDFFWGEYCDWYLEMSKIRIRSGDNSPIPIMSHVLEKILRILHPFLPFITEEIWQNLSTFIDEKNDNPPALMVSEYPLSNPELNDENAESQMSSVIELIRAIRNIRAEFRIQSTQPVESFVQATNEVVSVLESESLIIKRLAHVDSLKLNDADNYGGNKSKDCVSSVLSTGTLVVPLVGLVDLSQEQQRLAEELKDIDLNLEKLNKRLNDENFLAKAPEQVVEKERDRFNKISERRQRVSDTLARFSEI